MEIIYKGKKPELNVPYFGQQARYFKFFKECLKPYFKKFGIYTETHSGSNAKGFKYKRHTMLTQAINEDNLMKANYFKEYLYIIKGDIS